MEIQKILVIRLSSIGDVVLATPLVRSLRMKFPNAIIDFAIKKEFAILMKHHPHINQLVIVDSKDMATAKQQVKDNHYDWIIDIQKSSRATQLINGSGAKKITGYSKERFNRFFLINFHMNLYEEAKPVYLRYFEAVEEQGVEYDGNGTEIFVSSAEKEKVETLLTGLDLSKPIVVLCPGAKFANKTWGAERFMELGKILQKQHGANMILLGGPDEKHICEWIQSGLDKGSLNLAGKLNLLECAALMQRAKLVVANDSGLMHLAQSQKTPVVAIYGPTVKEFGFFPLPENSTVIETDLPLPCRPCTKMGKDLCPAEDHHHDCMKSITVIKVYDACKQYV